MTFEFEFLLVVIKGVFFLAFFGGFVVYLFGDKSFHPQLSVKEFLLPAGYFWVCGTLLILLSNNRNPILMMVLFSPKSDFPDDLALFSFALSYSFLLVALIRSVRKMLSGTGHP